MIEEIRERLSDDDRPVFTISIAAEMVGVSVQTLRLYECANLLSPQRSASQRRLYSRNDIERLRCIRIMLEDRGLNLAAIKTLLSLVPCWHIKGCNEEDRRNCDAYYEMGEPCWAVRNKGGICADIDCRHCVVYLSLAKCHNLKQYLKEHWQCDGDNQKSESSAPA